MNPELKKLFDELAAPFEPEYIYWKPGKLSGDKTSALALAYLDARGVMDRLDDVVGVAGWRDQYEPWGKASVKCTLSLNIGGEWLAKEDAADETNIESTKGGMSAALKRAAVKFGVGRYLYYVPSQWVPYDAKKKRIVKPPQLPEWALPGGGGRPPSTDVAEAVTQQAEVAESTRSSRAPRASAAQADISGILDAAELL